MHNPYNPVSIEDSQKTDQIAEERKRSRLHYALLGLWLFFFVVLQLVDSANVLILDAVAYKLFITACVSGFIIFAATYCLGMRTLRIALHVVVMLILLIWFTMVLEGHSVSTLPN